MLSKEVLFDILMHTQDATAIYSSEDILIETANEKMLSIWGRDASVIGMTMEEGLPELIGQPFIDILKNVWRTGITYTAVQMPADLLHSGNLVTKYYDFEYKAMKDADDKIVCIYNVAKDVTQKVLDQKNIEEAQSRINKLHENVVLANTELEKKNTILEEKNNLIKTSENNYRVVSTNLEQSRQELSYAIEAAGLGFFDLDVKSGTFKANSTTKKWFGLSPEENILLSDAINSIIPEDQERVTSAIEKVFEFESGGEYEITYTVKKYGNDEPRTLYVRGKVLFNEDNEAVRFSGIIQDVTEEARDEKRKNDFIGMVSHELKTPLTILGGALQMLQLTVASEEVEIKHTLHQKALNQVKKMTTMVNGFLTIGALDSGKISLQRSIFYVEELLKNVIEESIPLYKNHNFKTDIHCEVKMNADENKIQAVLANLVSNATKYSAAESDIILCCEVKDNNVILSVKDFGEGIEPEELHKLFDRYYRITNDKTITTPGFGLGLYLSAEIVKEHGGEIWAESKRGEGSVFFVSLPEF